MKAEEFNPFEDRFSRDIRNALSAALANRIETDDDSGLKAVIEDFEGRDLAPLYRDYFEDRCKRYKKALEFIKTGQNPLEQAVILWNQSLFFEVHEVLEHAWYDALGNEKLTLQALIRAAGVYVKQECGYTTAAAKIAAKSWPVLADNEALLAPYFNPAPLIAALKSPGQKPPKL